ncbi:hypothetical protein HHI36_011777 [Cryptolaemus montrouzieri]|uniref:Uncharacterized protein n=1 Tax=Cryptolaemus montrouzieri TaxID=559131 RepID=A0ABD2NCC3_9CUCU
MKEDNIDLSDDIMDEKSDDAYKTPEEHRNDTLRIKKPHLPVLLLPKKSRDDRQKKKREKMGALDNHKFCKHKESSKESLITISEKFITTTEIEATTSRSDIKVHLTQKRNVEE